MKLFNNTWVKNIMNNKLCLAVVFFTFLVPLSINSASAENAGLTEVSDVPDFSDVLSKNVRKFQKYQNGMVLDPIEVYTYDKKPFVITPDKEKLTILNFWGVWCPACVKDIMTLKEFAVKNPDVNVVYLSDRKLMLDVVKERSAFLELNPVQSYYDSRGLFKRWLKISLYPTVLVVGTDGRILYRVDGPMDFSQPWVTDFINGLKPQKGEKAS